MKPLVSIVIPVYKKEEFLERCMDSISGQTCQDRTGAENSATGLPGRIRGSW